jgi:hypothetical protein
VLHCRETSISCLYLSILLHYVTYNILSLFPSRCNNIYYIILPLPHYMFSALLGHLQVMIIVLDCHTVRCVYINIYFFYFIVYIKVFRSFLKVLLKSHKIFLSLKLVKNWPFIGCRPTLYMRVLCALQMFSYYVICCFIHAPAGPVHSCCMLYLVWPVTRVNRTSRGMHKTTKNVIRKQLQCT